MYRHLVLLALVMIGALFARQGRVVAGEGIELRVVDPLKPIYSAKDLPDPGAHKTLRLAGPRNGACSAQVVAAGGVPDGIRATVSALKSGSETISAQAIHVRYAEREQGYEIGKLDMREGHTTHRFTEPYYDRLLDHAPKGATLVPIWVTVKIPASAKPGRYTGALRVGGASVPVELVVAAWTCPKPDEWVTHAGIVPSAEALALRYGADFWSEKHWALIEQQLKLLGQVGCDDLWLHVLAGGRLRKGNAVVRFKTVGGSVLPDFTVVDRYLDLYARHVGRPQFVIVNVWGGRPRGKKGQRPKREVDVVVDGKPARVPMADAPGGQAIWQPMLEGIRKRVKARGWREDSILLALAGDQRPNEKMIAALKTFAPYARWAIWTHGQGEKPLYRFASDEKLVYSNGMELAYYVHPYTPHYSTWARGGPRGRRATITGGIQGGWNMGRCVYASTRNDIHKYAAPSQWRNYANGTMVSGYGMDNEAAGFAFLWMDFWTVPSATGWPFLNRWSTVMTRKNSPSFVEPGPDGPVATVRYEMLREGLQECEARIVIEKAVVGKKVTGDLARRSRALLEEMVSVRFQSGKFRGGHAGGNLGRADRMWGVAPYPRWQDATAKLFDLAGEVDRTVKEARRADER